MNRVWRMESLLSKSLTGILDSNQDAVCRHHLDTNRFLRHLFYLLGEVRHTTRRFCSKKTLVVGAYNADEDTGNITDIYYRLGFDRDLCEAEG